MPIGGRSRLPYRCVDQKERSKAAEDRIDKAGVGIGDYAFVIPPPARIPKQSQQKQDSDTAHHSDATTIGSR
jgi:hypothetical protein